MKHIEMTCENHTDLFWSCKSVAVSSAGRFNGQRSIFFKGRDRTKFPDEVPYQTVQECKCSGLKLIWTEAGHKDWNSVQ